LLELRVDPFDGLTFVSQRRVRVLNYIQGQLGNSRKKTSKVTTFDRSVSNIGVKHRCQTIPRTIARICQQILI
jgi:hypothetical protein